MELNSAMGFDLEGPGKGARMEKRLKVLVVEDEILVAFSMQEVLAPRRARGGWGGAATCTRPSVLPRPPSGSTSHLIVTWNPAEHPRSDRWGGVAGGLRCPACARRRELARPRPCVFGNLLFVIDVNFPFGNP
jgi:hypothetical protein